MTKANFDVVGMAVMGRNLALNMNLVFIQLPSITAQQTRREDVVASSKEKLCAKLWCGVFCKFYQPRRIVYGLAVLVRMHSAADKGWYLIDGGITFYKDTIRRERGNCNSGTNFIGTSVSGGERARKGHLLPGGQKHELVASCLGKKSLLKLLKTLPHVWLYRSWWRWSLCLNGP